MANLPGNALSDGEAMYNARASTPGYAAIFARWASDSAAYRTRALERGAARLDIAYGQDESERLDLFLPPGNPKGTLMYIHGGYWHSLDKSDASLVAPGFNKAGYAVAVVNYALCPAVAIEHIVSQVRAAAAWLYTNASEWKAPARSLYACGHSAGGQLAAMLLATNWQRVHAALPPRTVEGGIGISGLYDLRPLLRVPSLMKVVSLNDERAIKLSPALMQPSSSAPFLTAVGTQENAGFLEQAAIIRSAWPSSRSTQIDCAGRNHFTILDELTSESGSIFRAALQLMSPNT